MGWQGLASQGLEGDEIKATSQLAALVRATADEVLKKVDTGIWQSAHTLADAVETGEKEAIASALEDLEEKGHSAFGEEVGTTKSYFSDERSVRTTTLIIKQVRNAFKLTKPVPKTEVQTISGAAESSQAGNEQQPAPEGDRFSIKTALLIFKQCLIG